MKAIHTTAPDQVAASRFSAGLRTLVNNLQKSLSRWEWKWLAVLIGGFLVIYYLPVDSARFQGAVMESIHLATWYAQEHVILCLVPAFFIAGGIASFISQASVMKYLGANAPKVLAYGVASVSGSILAVCSCTILPLFAGIYRMGAGLGPAITFLYSGPAINVLAIILTASVLGPQLGIARAVGAIGFSIVIGGLMHLIFRKEEQEKSKAQMNLPEPQVKRPLWQTVVYFGSMAGILVFVNWGKPQDSNTLWAAVYEGRWLITAGFGLVFALILMRWFGIHWGEMLVAGGAVVIAANFFAGQPTVPFLVGVVALALLINRPVTDNDSEELAEWWQQSWGFAKQIMPLLFWGVLISGLLMGRPGHEGLIPSEWVYWAVGGNSPLSNFTAAFVGAFMYFATLTEVPILQGLLGSGMGQGPALALLLAGPALSLPNMLVIRSVLGNKKTAVFVGLVIIMATVSGLIYGNLYG
jgi:hypothetical protein